MIKYEQKKASNLLWIHKAVMVEILVVYGEATHATHLGVAGLVQVLAHKEHGIVYDVGGALGHGVHANNVNDAYDGLQQHCESVQRPVTIIKKKDFE